VKGEPQSTNSRKPLKKMSRPVTYSGDRSPVKLPKAPAGKRKSRPGRSLPGKQVGISSHSRTSNQRTPDFVSFCLRSGVVAFERQHGDFPVGTETNVLSMTQSRKKTRLYRRKIQNESRKYEKDEIPSAEELAWRKGARGKRCATFGWRQLFPS